MITNDALADHWKRVVGFPGTKVQENFIWDKEAGFGDLFDDKLELADFFKEIRRADVDSKYKRMKVSERYYDAQKTEIIK